MMIMEHGRTSIILMWIGILLIFPKHKRMIVQHDNKTIIPFTTKREGLCIFGTQVFEPLTFELGQNLWYNFF